MNDNAKHISENEQAHIDNLYDSTQRQLKKIKDESDLNNMQNKVAALSFLVGKDITKVEI